MKIENIICIGGGKSIQDGISLGLKEKIKDKCVLVCNYAYKHFVHSCLCFSDKDFYVPLYAKSPTHNHPDIYDDLKKEPLILGLNKNQGIEEFILPNTILLNSPNHIPLDLIPLTGIFALYIASFLQPNNIFLLGYDFTRQNKEGTGLQKRYANFDIHYYKDIKHKGTKMTGFYDRNKPDRYFKIFERISSKIYNVSLNSNINNFDKISYTKMFDILTNEELNQSSLREIIKNKLSSFQSYII